MHKTQHTWMTKGFMQSHQIERLAIGATKHKCYPYTVQLEVHETIVFIKITHDG